MKLKSVQGASAPASLMLAAFVGSLCPFAANAQEVVDEPEIVVTAPLEGSRIDSLQGADILQREDIVENLNGGLGDTLDEQPGVSTTNFGAGASRPIIRGLGEDRVRVLENGIGAIDASTASPDHAVTADGLDAQRIEILRGSAALAYGGNAVGGVVNVIDESIPTHAVGGVSFDGLAAYSSVNEGGEGSLSVGADAGPVVFRVTGSARETEDYDIPGYANSDGTGAFGTAPNSWTSLRTLTGGLSLVQDWGYAGVAVKRTKDSYGIPPEAPGEPGGHIELEQTRVEARGDIRLRFGPFTRLDFGAQSSDYEHTEFEGDGATGTRFESSGWEGRVEAHHQSDRLRGAVGLQYSDVDFAAFGGEAFITPTDTQNAGVFVVERWDAGGWGLEGGARYERSQLDNDGAGQLGFDNVSASLGAFVRPAEGWFIGATVARTERSPTQIELFADGPHLATANYEIGDATLDQEIASSLEFSVRYAGGPWRIEANLFGIDFHNYIALVDRGDFWWSDEITDTSGFAPTETDPSIPVDATVIPVFNFVQRDATFIGGELTVRRELFDAAGFTFSGDVGYDIVRAAFDGGGRPPRIPPSSLRVGFSGESDHWGGRIEVVDTAKQDRTAPFETETDGYTFLNAGISFRPYGDGRVVLRLDGRNLTDEEGRVHASFLKDELPLPGRNVRFVVSTSF